MNEIDESAYCRHIGDKKIFTVSNHKEAISAWTTIGIENTNPPWLLSFDRHTDTHPAFLRDFSRVHPGVVNPEAAALHRNSQISSIDRMNVDSVQRMVPLLHHDEQIDAALGSNIIKTAVIISHNEHQDTPSIHLPLDGSSEHQAIVLGYAVGLCDRQKEEFDPLEMPYCDDILESWYLRGKLLALESFLADIEMPNFEGSDYILDIDLDYFLTERSIAPADPECFHNLISGALAITIARESGMVLDGRMKGETITSNSLEADLAHHIEAACK